MLRSGFPAMLRPLGAADRLFGPHVWKIARCFGTEKPPADGPPSKAYSKVNDRGATKGKETYWYVNKDPIPAHKSISVMLPADEFNVLKPTDLRFKSNLARDEKELTAHLERIFQRDKARFSG